MRLSASVIVLIAFAAAGCARTPESKPANATAGDAAGHDAHSPAPAARTTLLGDLGSYHRSIKTANDEAQKFFDEGLTLLYGFNHEEAFRSFERAAALDDKAPMPHWGMSLALGTNYNDTATPDRIQQAYSHLTHAQQRAANGSDVERSFIDALAKRYVATPDDGNQRKREEAYSAAMGEVSRKFPDDLDAATLYAESMMNLRPWKLYTAAGVPEPGTEEIVATLESVLKRNSDHPGANHYLIHAVEASRTPERAETSAKRLETLVPAAGHLVHMPAHIWMRTGEYRSAVKTNADAARLDEQYVKATGATGMYPTMYYGHNLQFESAAAMMAGNLAAARAAGQKTAALVSPMAGDMAMLQPFTLQEVLALRAIRAVGRGSRAAGAARRTRFADGAVSLHPRRGARRQGPGGGSDEGAGGLRSVSGEGAGGRDVPHGELGARRAASGARGSRRPHRRRAEGQREGDRRLENGRGSRRQGELRRAAGLAAADA